MTLASSPFPPGFRVGARNDGFCKSASVPLQILKQVQNDIREYGMTCGSMGERDAETSSA